MRANFKLESRAVVEAMQSSRRKALVSKPVEAVAPALSPADPSEWLWFAFYSTCAVTAVVWMVINW